MALDMSKIRDSFKTSSKWFANLLNLASKGQRGTTTNKEADYLVVANSLEYGEMFFYMYDAEHKAKLNVWDQFPLIIYAGPSKKRPQNWIGFNLHYLNIPMRIRILSELDDIQKNNKYDIVLKERFINFLMNDPRMKPCIKEYRRQNIRSSFYFIKREAWETVAALPDQEEWKYRDSGKSAPKPY